MDKNRFFHWCCCYGALLHHGDGSRRRNVGRIRGVLMLNKFYKYGLPIVITVLVALYFFLDPVLFNFPACPVNKITGFYCPGCGSQRALHHLLNGNIGQSLSFNPLLFLTILLIFYNLLLLLFLKTTSNLLYNRFSPIIIVVVVIIFTTLRNLPQYPFSLLAPN